ncbi:MAG: class I SAM-dependent methyltransferase [Methanobacteriota archaeon]|nr:MAG: class I SAM-dependent methyltransferase [Euryarchaeota archaeon]
MRPTDGDAWALVQRHIFPGKTDPTSFYERKRWAMLFSEMLEEPHQVVVEIGSGWGLGTRCMANAPGIGVAIGVDADAVGSLVDAPRVGRPPEFVQANVEGTLPFRPGSVDCMIAPEVYEHFYHPALFFQEAHRVLRPGGRLILTTPNTESIALMVLRRLPRRWAQRMLTREGDAKKHLHPEFFGDLSTGGPHGHRVEGASLMEMERMAAQYGFRQVRATTWGLPFAGPAWEKMPRPMREFLLGRFHALAVGLRHIFVVWKRDDEPVKSRAA